MLSPLTPEPYYAGGERRPKLHAKFTLVQVKIELLYWDGCPSHPEALSLLHEVLAEVGVTSSVEQIEVVTDEDAVRLSFPGSPTIRIDGRDVDPEGAAARPALTCRIYRGHDGKVSPIPSRAQLQEALR